MLCAEARVVITDNTVTSYIIISEGVFFFFFVVMAVSLRIDHTRPVKVGEYSKLFCRK